MEMEGGGQTYDGERDGIQSAEGKNMKKKVAKMVTSGWEREREKDE